MRMSVDDYREALKLFGTTQEEFAVLLGAGARSGQRWATVRVPPAVATLVRLLLVRPELVDVLKDLNQPPKE